MTALLTHADWVAKTDTRAGRLADAHVLLTQIHSALRHRHEARGGNVSCAALMGFLPSRLGNRRGKVSRPARLSLSQGIHQFRNDVADVLAGRGDDAAVSVSSLAHLHAPSFHAPEHGPEVFGDVRKVVGEIRNV